MRVTRTVCIAGALLTITALAYADSIPAFIFVRLADLTRRVTALEATDPVPGPQGPTGPQGPPGPPGPPGTLPAQTCAVDEFVIGHDGAGTLICEPVPGASSAAVAIVASAGGNYATIGSAIANIATGDSWCGTPSSSNPCLIRVMPGTYDVGTASVLLDQHVHLQGSGRGITTITGGGSEVLYATGNNSIRDLTITVPFGAFRNGVAVTGANVLVQSVQAASTTTDNIGRFALDVSAAGSVAAQSLDVVQFNLVARVTGGAATFDGLSNTGTNGVFAFSGGTIEITNSIVRNQSSTPSSSIGIGVFADGSGSQIVVRHSQINTVYSTDGASVRISNSEINGTARDIDGSVPGTIEIYNSQFFGVILAGFGWGTQTHCVFTAGSLGPLDASCLP